MPSIFAAPMGAAYHVVVTLALILAPLAGGLATAAAIVVFTMAARLLLVPLSFYAMRGQASIAAIQPRVQELRTRYARQPDRLHAELGALYRQEGGGLLAGCLPLLLQLPFFSIMYRLFLSRTVDGRPNSLLTRHLLGTRLGSHWLTGAGPVSGQGLVFLGLFALLAVVAILAVRVSRVSSPAPGAQAAGPLGVVTRLLPYSTLVLAAFVPLAAGLYLLTTTAWTAVERTVLRRRISPGLPVSNARAKRPAGSVP
jgi:YidC/Oxa1 family membrane protein insertase